MCDEHKSKGSTGLCSHEQTVNRDKKKEKEEKYFCTGNICKYLIFEGKRKKLVFLLRRLLFEVCDNFIFFFIGIFYVDPFFEFIFIRQTQNLLKKYKKCL